MLASNSIILKNSKGENNHNRKQARKCDRQCSVLIVFCSSYFTLYIKLSRERGLCWGILARGLAVRTEPIFPGEV